VRPFVILPLLATAALQAATGAGAAPAAGGPPPPQAPSLAPLPPVRAVPGNEPTAARLELGQRLFFDRRLSGDGRRSCASCHWPESGWTVPTPFSPAAPGWVERRNSPSLLNVGHARVLIWDGRAPDLERQALGSTRNPVHMGQTLEGLLAALRSDARYRRLFREAYGSEPNPRDYGRALAVFERHALVSGDSPLDRHLQGEASALSPAARRGLALFRGKAGCIRCHHGPTLSDGGFHNVGLARNRRFDEPPWRRLLRFDARRMGLPEWEAMDDDPGRYLVTRDRRDWKRFKTPTLRNVALTAPYMHDGRYATLEEVVAHYDRGGDGVPGQEIRPLGLSDRERAELVAFLRALTGRRPALPLPLAETAPP